MGAPRTSPARTIVVGADGSEGSDRAIAWAAREAVTASSTLRIVSVWSVPAAVWAAGFATAYIDPEDLRAGALATLDRARAVAVGAAASLDLEVETVEVQGVVAEQLLAHSQDATLLVVGTRGRGELASALLGSVAVACAHHCTVPLAVIGDGAPPPGTGDIVVGVDDSPGGRAALRWAAGEAGRVGAAIRAVHGWEVPTAGAAEPLGRTWDPELVDAVQRGFERLVAEEVPASADAPAVEAVAILRSVPDALVTESKQAALLVVGSRGRGGFRGLLLGSVSQHCLHHGHCPVVIVPTEDQAAERRTTTDPER